MTPKKDIEGLDDIIVLVDEFYALVREDKLLAPIFLERLNSHWEHHLEKMYAFWNAALFGIRGYVGNPFARHATMPVNGEHFEHWISLFIRTVDTYFEGPIAEDAKRRAGIMAATFERRIGDLKGSNTIPLV